MGNEAIRMQCGSEILASIHETAEGLHSAGVMDEQTMREFDALCLTPVQPLAPEAIPARPPESLFERTPRPADRGDSE